jgi:hypothetical protein
MSGLEFHQMSLDPPARPYQSGPILRSVLQCPNACWSKPGRTLAEAAPNDRATTLPGLDFGPRNLAVASL